MATTKKTNAKGTTKAAKSTKRVAKKAVDKAVAEAIKDAPKNKALDKAVEVKLTKKRAEATTLDGILHASTVGSPCYLVWDLADKMKDARRKDVIAAAVKKGVAFYTARTQYQKWYEASHAK